jgi:hypothetical protein
VRRVLFAGGEACKIISVLCVRFVCVDAAPRRTALQGLDRWLRAPVRSRPAIHE